ncbi:MAG: sulfur carrier protein ThiS [Segniliparus sp.]|uniref:sulfur carrier protein ThiS n=1 Tax=Segniliparus sp. TaxID=2804064 RepID=UPI003F2CCFF6
MGEILITANGEEHSLPEGAAIADLLERLGLSPKGIAVAVDGVVSPRGEWDQPLRPGAAVEILTAVPGG